MPEPHPQVAMRKWYSSLLFWLGIPGFIFLLWLWQDTNDHLTEFIWNGSSTSFVVISDDGMLDCTKYPFAVNFKPQNMSLERYPNSVQSISSWSIGGLNLPQALDTGSHPEFQELEVPRFRISYWLLTLIYLIAWISLIFGWRRWQMKKRKDAGQHPSGHH